VRGGADEIAMGPLKRWFASGAECSTPACGVRDGRLAPCPAAPRCVSTLARDAAHRVAPIGYHCTRPEVHAMLIDALHGWPRTRIVTVDEDYIHAVQRSRWLGFADDLECHLPTDERLVHVRSAARVGWYDLGVNRARVERLRRDVNRRLAALR
jgi:uncharacterized protein (DUF1499 family)